MVRSISVKATQDKHLGFLFCISICGFFVVFFFGWGAEGGWLIVVCFVLVFVVCGVLCH